MASTDSIEDNTGFAEKNGATFPVLSDPGGEVVDAFGALSPSGYARRWTFYIGPDGKVLRIDQSVNPRTAGADLVTNLEELGVPPATNDEEPQP